MRCPLNLKCPPNSPCSLGREGRDAARDGKVGGCPMFISSAADNYCVYSYLANEGRPTDVPKVARLAMIDENEVKAITNRFKKIAAEILNG